MGKKTPIASAIDEQMNSTPARGRSRSAGLSRASVRRVLDARVVFDGAGVATAADVVDQPAEQSAPALPPAPAETTESNEESSAPVSDTAANAAAPADDANTEEADDSSTDTADTAISDESTPDPDSTLLDSDSNVDAVLDDTEEQPEITQVVFVDASIQDYELLVDDVVGALEGDHQAEATDFAIDETSDNAGTVIGETLFVVIDRTSDGLEQIADTLESQENLGAVHIVSHGYDSMLRLGNAWVDSNTVDGYADTLARIGDSLADGGDILLYGCDVAQTDAGKNFVDRLGELSGADVGASIDTTGNNTDAANWDLEYSLGTVQAHTITGLNADFGWQGKLANFVVTTTAATGTNSLAWAIDQANITTGIDTITFNIGPTDTGHLYYTNNGTAGSVTPGLMSPTTATNDSALAFSIDPDHTSSWFRITPDASGLPWITDAVIIDATTQSQYVDKPVIEINGSNSNADVNGLRLAGGSDGSTIIGLNINSFTDDGIQIDSDNNQIYGNRIGTEIAGLIGGGFGNEDGIDINGDNNTIGGTGTIGISGSQSNLISGNDATGINIDGARIDNTILNNWIGIDSTGDGDLGNRFEGIKDNDGDNLEILNNVISGSINSDGVNLNNTDNADIRGNIIGLNASGTAVIGNSDDGIDVEGDDNTIGGANVADRNIISGSEFNNGIEVGNNSTGTLIQGNYIGTDITGNVDLGNTGSGVMDDGATGTEIRGNVISGNEQDGIRMQGDASEIHGNYIGLDAEGDTALGNTGDGIDVEGDDHQIGTVIPGDRNVISANGQQGIEVHSGSNDVVIDSNYIGTDRFGTLDLGNSQNGVLDGGSNRLDITGNLISANDVNGVLLTGSVDTTITDNRIGTNAAGTAALGNAEDGIFDDAQSGTVIGDTSSVNIISGNGDDGIYTISDGTVIVGNYIGTDFNADYAIGNGTHGIQINADDVTVGGYAVGERNVISGNGVNGVGGSGINIAAGSSDIDIHGNSIGIDGLGTSAVANTLDGIKDNGSTRTNIDGNTISGNTHRGIAGSLSTDTTITNNFIGLDFYGGNVIGNGHQGIRFDTATGVEIGGTIADGNVISGNGLDGIYINGDQANITGNFIGTDVSGQLDRGNGESGIHLEGDTHNVGGATLNYANTISGNNGEGILLDGGQLTDISNNFIGTTANGAGDLGNDLDGIRLETSFDVDITDNIISGNGESGIDGVTSDSLNVFRNTIGTNLAGTAQIENNRDGVELFDSASAVIDGNHIAGNLLNGIRLNGSHLAEITDNLIGTDGTGTNYLGNEDDGLHIVLSDNVTVGGTGGDGNVISGNQDNGIYWSSSDNGTIQGNYIGTDITGTASIQNYNNGIELFGNDVLIGGSGGGEGNVISGNNNDGIRIIANSTGIEIQGNLIGTDASGTAALGNGNTAPGGRGIALIGDNITDNTIGGVNAGEGNVIANNASDGIALVGATSNYDNSILGNLIYANADGGIDLGADGVTNNDVDDLDLQENDLQNFPVLTTVETDGLGNIEIIGTLESHPATDYRIEFFANSTQDPSLHGEAEQYLGFIDVTTGGTGLVLFTHTDSATTLALGSFVTATATVRPTASTFGSTSEFATNKQAVAINSAPTFTSHSGSSIVNLNINEGDTAVTTVTATDPDLPGDTLTYSLGGVDAGLFNLSPAGVLTFNPAPDFEVPTDTGNDNTYTITVSVTDSAGNQDHQNFFIDVNDLAPTITSYGGATTVTENVDENDGTPFATVVANDPVTGTVNYVLSSSTGAANEDVGVFAVDFNTGQLSFSPNPNFESMTSADGDKVFNVQVIAQDAGGTGSAQNFEVTLNDLAPAITSYGGAATHPLSVAEGTTATLATVAGTDPAGGSVTYHIVPGTGTGNEDSGLFTVDATTGALSFNAPPDFESPGDSDTDNIYNVQIEARDADNTASTPQNFVITVTDTNEAPVITSYTGSSVVPLTVVEGTATSVAIADVNATDPEGDTLQYQISPTTGTFNADAGLFSVNGTTGELTFQAIPDYDTQLDAGPNGVYNVRVEVLDIPTGNMVYQDFEITVLDANPVITSYGGSTSHSVSVPEGTTATVATITATDPGGGAMQYFVNSTAGAGNADGTLFNVDVNTGEVTFQSPPNFESPTGSANGDNIYDVTIDAVDPSGNIVSQVVFVTVADQAPVISSYGGATTHAVSIVEGNTGTIATIAAADPAGGAVTYSVNPATLVPNNLDHLLFQVDGSGNLSFQAAPDFETPLDSDTDNIYTVQLIAQDADGTQSTQDYEVTVTNANESPVITSYGGVVTHLVNLVEGSATSVIAADVDATDPDGTPLTYSISSVTGGGANIDSSMFTMTAAGELSLNFVPDYENPIDSDPNNVYNVRVEVTDGTVTVYQDIQVNVTDAAPSITSYGGTSSQALNVAEGTAGTFATVAATDPAGGTVTYHLVAGTGAGNEDSGLFTVNATTGALSFTAAPDYETPLDNGSNNIYNVQVEARDVDGTTSPAQAFVITVTDSNEAPTITSYGANAVVPISVVEGTPVAVVIADVDATDPDGDTLQYQISSDAATYNEDSSFFNINASTGELTFNSVPNHDTPLDVNNNNNYKVRVEVLDVPTGNMVFQDFVVSVTDASPVITSYGGVWNHAVTVPEGTTATVATVGATDPGGGVITYSVNTSVTLWNEDSAFFTVNSSTGDVTFQLPPDFESTTGSADGDNVYHVRIDAADASSTTTYQHLFITVSDEAPVISSYGGVGTHSVSVPEGTSAPVATVAATDPAGGTVTYAINSSPGTGHVDGGLFSVDGSGNLTFNAAPDHEAPTDSDGDNIYNVHVVASDADGTSSTQIIEVTVTDANENPNLNSSNYTVFEGTVGVVTLTASDPDLPGDAMQYQLTGGPDQGMFTLNQTTGELSFVGGGAPAVAAPGDVNQDNVYEIEVTVSDGNGGTDIKTILVNVMAPAGFAGPGVGEPPAAPSDPVTDDVDPEPPVDPETDPEPTTETDPETETETDPGTEEPTLRSKPEEQILETDIADAELVGGSSDPVTIESLRTQIQDTVRTLSTAMESITAQTTMAGFDYERTELTTSLLNLDLDMADVDYDLSLLNMDAKPAELSRALLTALDHVLEKLADPNAQTDGQMVFTNTAIGITLSFSVGYVGWLLRFGYLLAGFLSVVPTLRTFDPLPVLASSKKPANASTGDDDEDDEDDKLEEMFEA